MSTALDPHLLERDQYTARLAESPYNASIYLERARCHEKLKYPDLAASDAYKALILSDELLDEVGEYHEKAVEANLKSGIQPQTNNANGPTNAYHSLEGGTSGNQSSNTMDALYTQEAQSWNKAVAEGQSCQAYEILARTLIECGDLKSAWDFADRGSRVFPYNASLQSLRAQAFSTYVQEQLRRDPTWDAESVHPRKDLPHTGLVRREIYPWNSLEPDRFSPSAVSYLNAEMAKVAPKIEVRSVDLPLLGSDATIHLSTTNNRERREQVMLRQLGLFATSDISHNEQILFEPSILTANNRLHDPLCDACSAPLSVSTSTSLPSCPSCDDTVFCSASCRDRAQTLYHPAICGQSDFDLSTRDPSPAAATDALYLLLLARTMSMAETQDLHPLSLCETKYLWGEFNTPSTSSILPNSLPFSFQTNVAIPLHLLENLNLDIFAPETVARYDTWIINTLLAKFRSVASAKLNPRTGMPEVCAVHWRWCLANHSCAPNVRWEWPSVQASGPTEAADVDVKEQERSGGCMALFARGGKDVVQWGPAAVGKRLGGIKKGEEVMSHYCDVELSVEARREWASGPLGGVCICERCVWEADAAAAAQNAAPNVNATTPSSGSRNGSSGSG